MTTHDEGTVMADDERSLDFDRRDFFKATGRALMALGVVAAIGSSALAADAAYVPDLSNGADNFYRSNRVNVQRVSFKNQYGMRVAGNLFTPKTLFFALFGFFFDRHTDIQFVFRKPRALPA